MTQPSTTKEAGIIQLPLSATQKAAPAKRTPKVAAPRLKLIIRRLPPGLTRAEFETGLGDDWRVGRGRIDWFQFKPGKISKDPAKPSRPARAYVHVLSEEIIGSLSEKVRATSFHDARNTSNDPVLLGPPSVEFAPFARVPGSRSRRDGRQGTIDQDPEFVAFLESLTNPITKPTQVEGEAEKEEEAVTITPLVQYIKEKKASKAKDSASGKSSKRAAKEKEAKAEKVESKKLLKRPDREATADSTPASPEKKPAIAKLEKATKEAVKAASTQASATKSKQASAKESAPSPDTSASTSERKRERGDARAAAMILQRDLGLAPSGGRRRGKPAAITTEGDQPKAEETKSKAVPSASTIPTGPKASRASAKAAKDSTSKATAAKASTSTTTATPSEPSSAAMTTDSTAPATTPRAAKSAKQQKPKQPAVSATATQAFLKHANPSQGVTEELLDIAFSVFGKVNKVEIDKKKGFGYVDFAEPDGLQKAIAASPVTVAQSQVVVLERKNPPAQQQQQAKAAAKAGGETASQATSAASVPAPQQAGGGGGTQKRSRGPRSRGVRGKGKAAAGEAENAGKSEEK